MQTPHLFPLLLQWVLLMIGLIDGQPPTSRALRRLLGSSPACCVTASPSVVQSSSCASPSLGPWLMPSPLKKAKMAKFHIQMFCVTTGVMNSRHRYCTRSVCHVPDTAASHSGWRSLGAVQALEREARGLHQGMMKSYPLTAKLRRTFGMAPATGRRSLGVSYPCLSASKSSEYEVVMCGADAQPTVAHADGEGLTQCRSSGCTPAIAMDSNTTHRMTSEFVCWTDTRSIFFYPGSPISLSSLIASTSAASLAPTSTTMFKPKLTSISRGYQLPPHLLRTFLGVESSAMFGMLFAHKEPAKHTAGFCEKHEFMLYFLAAAHDPSNPIMLVSFGSAAYLTILRPIEREAATCPLTPELEHDSSTVKNEPTES
ncbi:hypothetical protein CERSUDRAFT_74436 [Gelatoporia subvermispora B]|uniref:Uncharacterized protein n=1 Tax=Ceriporiopsis subvermispora (strain B) TaxID=914234 RepID=M2RDH2_CERS8|nr:hypothetical protein CERSUDRAFT_74436 [Gelatoporia subvermispora B]